MPHDDKPFLPPTRLRGEAPIRRQTERAIRDVQRKISDEYVPFSGGTFVGDVTFSARVLVGDGTAATPSFAFELDEDNGMFRPTEDALGFSSGGFERVRISSDATPSSILSIFAETSGDAQLSIGGAESTLHGILYEEDGVGTRRYALRIDNRTGFNDVYLSNRASNGLVRIVANNATAGGAGEGEVARFSFASSKPQVLLQAGEAANPSLAFEGDPDTGWYLSATGELSAATAGAQRLAIGATIEPKVATDWDSNSNIWRFLSTGTGHTITVDIRAVSDFGDDFVFIRKGGTSGTKNIHGFAFGNNDTPVIVLSAQDQGVFVADGSVTAPSLSFISEQDSGMYVVGTNQIGFAAGGVAQFETGNSTNPGILLDDGTDARPGLAFTADTDTGIRLGSVGVLRFIIGGTAEMIVQAGDIDMQNNVLSDVNEVQAADGGTSDPSYTFSSDLDSGMYLVTSNDVGIVAGGSISARFRATNVALTTGTTASSANLFQSTSLGAILRSTSSMKIKTAIAPLRDEYQLPDIIPAEKRRGARPLSGSVLSVVPVTFRSLAEGDDSRVVRLGMVLEQVGQVFPRGVVGESLDWQAFVSALIHEVRQLKDQVAVLEAA